MNIDKKLSLYLISTFILFTVIGTLSHEGGHYFAAKALGYKASINYAFTHWEDPATKPFLDSIYEKYKEEIIAGKDFPQKEKFIKISRAQSKDSKAILMWGPLQTMITGTIGFILLLLFRKSFQSATRLNFKQWLLIFISLFWLRQPTNFIVWLGNYFIKGTWSYRGDEIKIAQYCRVPIWSVTLITAILGTIVLINVIFKFIPVNQRKTFIVSGLIGGILGYVMWIITLGPVIMP